MLYLFDYRDVRGFQQERERRSLEKLTVSGRTAPDSYMRAAPQEEAEILELVFPPACETDRIGA